MASGRCICGAVSFVVNGPLRDVVLCHCTECRRWAGHVWAATAARFDELEFSEDRGLRWIDSPDSVHDARRGFCGQCGSSLFWQVPGAEKVSIAAGCLDAPTGIRTVDEIWLESAGDYYEVDRQGRHIASYLHTCYRIGDIDRSVSFYEKLGFDERARMNIGEEAINVFMGLPGEDPVLELTYNHGVDSYELGTGYNHIAIAVDDLDGTLAGLAEDGIEPEKPPYRPGGRTEGSFIAFVRDPDGYRIELIGR